jgi:hypothetical protein
MKCYGLGLGLDTFRLVALDANFRKLEDTVTMAAYRRCGVTGQMQTRGCCAGLDALLWFCMPDCCLFRLVALDANFMKLEDSMTMAADRRCVVGFLAWFVACMRCVYTVTMALLLFCMFWGVLCAVLCVPASGAWRKLQEAGGYCDHGGIHEVRVFWRSVCKHVDVLQEVWCSCG